MHSKVDLEKLLLAYNRRMQYIEDEMTYDGVANATLETLKMSRILTENTSQLLLPIADEVAEYGNYTRDKVNMVTEARLEEIEKLKVLQDQGAQVPRFLLDLAEFGNNNAELQVKMLFDEDLLVKKCMDYLLICLYALYAEEDDEPRRAFIRSVKTSLLDGFLGAFPGGQIIMSATRSIEAYLIARTEQRNSANCYLRALETYNEACFNWCNGVVAWIKGLQEVRGEQPA